MMIYRLLSRLLPTKPPPDAPARIIVIRPCCIGDVVMATGAVQALRQRFPQAHLTWAVGGWSSGVVELLIANGTVNTIMDTGARDLPVRSLGGFWRFVQGLRAGHYDLAVSLVRSPLMSLAVLLAGIPHRVGIDSDGRGFGYTVRVPVDPKQARHEARIYLDVVQALNAITDHVYPQLHPMTDEFSVMRERLREQGIIGDYLVFNPNGGNNPGMVLDIKRYPPEQCATVADNLADALGCQVVIIGADSDFTTIEAMRVRMRHEAVVLLNQSINDLALLCQQARVYVGNDTGITHLAAAVGAKTVMILGPTNPDRYAPYTPPGQSLALWQPTTGNNTAGVSAGVPLAWTWAQHGIQVGDATAQILAFLR